MKAFWSSVLLMVVIAVLAWAVLGVIDLPTSEVFTSESGTVRL